VVKPTLQEIEASDLTPLERELALASFGTPDTLPPAKPAAAAASRESAPVFRPDPALLQNPHFQAWRAHLDGLRARNAIARPLRGSYSKRLACGCRWGRK
jgi:flagellum-specific ATP synthase